MSCEILLQKLVNYASDPLNMVNFLQILIYTNQALIPITEF